MKQPRDLEALKMMYQIESPPTFPFNEHTSSEFYGTFHRYMSSALLCMGREDEAPVYVIKLAATARLHKAKVDRIDLWILVSSWQTGHSRLNDGLCYLQINSLVFQATWSPYEAVLFYGWLWMPSMPLLNLRQSVMCIAGIFLIFPWVLQLFTLLFNCGQFDQPRLMADTDVICSDPGHEVRQYVAIAGICTNSLGTPLVFFLMLKHYGCARLHQKEVAEKLGFLYNSYEANFLLVGLHALAPQGLLRVHLPRLRHQVSLAEQSSAKE